MIYLLWRDGRTLWGALILINFWFIIPILVILLIGIIIISGRLTYKWINDSIIGKKLYMVIVLLIVIALWLSTAKMFSYMDYLTKYQYPSMGSW